MNFAVAGHWEDFLPVMLFLYSPFSVLVLLIHQKGDCLLEIPISAWSLG